MVETSRDQSKEVPMLRILFFMYAIFFSVQSRGFNLFLIAAFSAGRPNASNPIGYMTFFPCIRFARAKISGTANAYQCPSWRLPDGYGNSTRRKKLSLPGTASGVVYILFVSQTFSHLDSIFARSYFLPLLLT